MFAGSKELECDHRIAGVKVRMTVGADKASAAFSGTIIDQSRPGDQAGGSVSHHGFPIASLRLFWGGNQHRSELTHLGTSGPKSGLSTAAKREKRTEGVPARRDIQL